MTVIRSPMNEQDYLIHYGVLGMKWGVRKDRKSSGSVRSKNSSDSSKETKSTVKKKRIKDMTDAELLKRRDRLRLEKEVKTLTNETDSTAKRIAKKALTRAGEKVVEEVAHDVAKYVVGEQIINKHAGTKIVNIKSSDEKKKKDKDL